jgi:hypothetical protein
MRTQAWTRMTQFTDGLDSVPCSDHYSMATLPCRLAALRADPWANYGHTWQTVPSRGLSRSIERRLAKHELICGLVPWAAVRGWALMLRVRHTACWHLSVGGPVDVVLIDAKGARCVPSCPPPNPDDRAPVPQAAGASWATALFADPMGNKDRASGVARGLIEVRAGRGWIGSSCAPLELS